MRRWSLASFEILRPLPAIAFLPLALLLFNFSLTTELVLMVYASIWPVLVNTMGGVMAVTPRLYDVGRTIAALAHANAGEHHHPRRRSGDRDRLPAQHGIGSGHGDHRRDDRQPARPRLCGHQRTAGDATSAHVRLCAVHRAAVDLAQCSPASDQRARAARVTAGRMITMRNAVMLRRWQRCATRRVSCRCFLAWQRGRPSDRSNRPIFPRQSAWFDSVLFRRGADGYGRHSPRRSPASSPGLRCACLIGFALGLFIGARPACGARSNPLLEFCRGLPPPVLVPVAVLLLGYAESLKLFIILWVSVLAYPPQHGDRSRPARRTSDRRVAHPPFQPCDRPCARSSAPAVVPAFLLACASPFR